MLSPRWLECQGFSQVSRALVELLDSSRFQQPPDEQDSSVRILLPSTAAREVFAASARTGPKALRDIPGEAISSVDGFLDALVASNEGAPQRSDSLFREALLEQAFEEMAVDNPPPFPLRAGLVRRVLAFYDRLTLNHPVSPVSQPAAGDPAEGEPSGTLDLFQHQAMEMLDAPDDIGAERLAAQTRFLIASLTRYRAILATSSHTDPIGLLDWIAKQRPRSPCRHLVILNAATVRVAELDAFSKLSGLLTLDILSPKNLSRDSWQSRFFSDAPVRHDSDSPQADPSRLVWLSQESSNGPEPGLRAESDPCMVARDREDSIQRVAKILKARDAAGALPPLDRVAIVVPRPLPYLYVAKKILTECAIPFQLRDTFPLAAEPYVGSLDLFLEFCESGARRDSTLSLLSSPFFCFPDMDASTLSAFASTTLRYREMGGFRRWHRLWERTNQPRRQPNLPGIDSRDEQSELLRVLELLVQLEETVAPILDPNARLSAKLDALERFLHEFELPPAAQNDSPLSEISQRAARARGGVREVLTHWRWVVGESADPRMNAADFRGRVHRAFEDRTFALQSEASQSAKVQIVDASTAGFGAFDLVFLVGLNDTEWPSSRDRDVFYPQWFLRDFGWPSDHELLLRERRRFIDLLSLSGGELALLRHELEDDLPTIPSPFLEDASEWLEQHAKPLTLASPLPIVSRSEALRRGRIDFDPPPRAQTAAGMLEAKLRVPEPVSATSLETFLRCPFKYYSRYLLRLEEEDTIDEGMNPLERGRLLHEILHQGFAEWDSASSTPRAVTVDNFDEAIKLFRRVAAERLPGPKRREELNRLFGSGGRPGAIEWILRRELSQPGLRSRLVEYGFQAPIQLREGPDGESPWFVQIKGRVDRADIDNEGGLHVYDYKTGRAPALATTLQVPLYAMCLSQEFDAPVREAAYLSLRDNEARQRADFEDASQKLKNTMGEIRNGRFSPKPSNPSLCSYCGYVALCRKEIEDYGRSLEGDDA